MKKKVITIIYFALSIFMYFFYSNYFSVGGIFVLHTYLAGVAITVFAFFVFLADPHPRRMVKILSYAGVLSVPYLVTIIYSMVVWISDLTSIRIMLRGIVWPIYQVIAIFAGASAVYLFGKRGIYYQLISLIVAYMLFFVQLAGKFGPVKVIGDFISTVVSLGDNIGCFSNIEKIAYAHGMGVFLLFLVLTMKENKQINRVMLIPCVMCFMSGFKRSAVVGFLLAGMVFVIGSHLKDVNFKHFFSLVGILMSLGALLYIWIVDSAVLDMVIDKFNINTMGRQEVYHYIKPYYEFTPAFLGKGLGFISYNLGNNLIDIGGSSRGDIHNDFLRMYIELGMIGFVSWAWTFFRLRTKHLVNMVDERYGLFALSCMGYCWGCYLSENMYYRFNTTLAIAVVLIGYAFQRSEENEKIKEGLA